MTSATSQPRPDVPPDPAGAPGRLSAAGAALLEAGRPDEAVEILRHAVAAAEPGADDLLARAYLDCGDWFGAADHLGRLVARGQAGRHDEPGWQFGLGRFLVDDGRAPEARPCVAAAAALGDGEAATLLAEIDGEDPFDD